MKLYEVALVKDCGEYFEIISVLWNSELYSIPTDKNSKHLKLNNLASDIIKRKIENNEFIGIRKDLDHPEVQIKDLLSSTETKNDFQLYKENALRKAAQAFNPQLVNSSGLTLYGYMELNNYFNSKGYYIHEENKQKVYSDILKTDDEELINKLEQYLEHKDSLDMVFRGYERYNKLKDEIYDCEDTTEVDKALRAYLIYINEGNNKS